MKIERIESRQNRFMVRLGRLLTSRKYRYQEHCFAGEGTKLLQEALRWIPQDLEAVVLSEGMEFPRMPDTVRRIQLPEELMRRISTLEHPEGAIFLARMPERREAAVAPGTLVLDRLQDPGNVGTILRTADAMDVPVCLLEGCADPYSPKTVRASMGAVLRTPPAFMTEAQLLAALGETPLAATALRPGAVEPSAELLRACAVVIGSEGGGVSDGLLEAADHILKLPMHPRCESLCASAAAAIVLWEMRNI